jgi:hypothetical protein
MEQTSGQVSSTANVEIIYPHPIKTLDEQEYHSTVDLTKKLNEVIVMLNRLRSAL